MTRRLYLREQSMKRILLIAVLLAAGCGNAPSDGHKFLLTFAPPDSVTYHAEVMRVSARYVGADTSQVDSSWSQTTHDMEKDAEGWVIHSQTDTMWVSRNGQPVNDPIVTLFASGKFTHLINNNGQIRDIQGYEFLFNKLDTILGPERSAEVRSTINPAQLKSRDMDEWNYRMGRYAGSELALDDPKYDTVSVPMPTGALLRAFEVSELFDTVRIDTALCAVIRTTSHTDPRELARLVGRDPDDLVKTFAVSDSLLDAINRSQVSSMIQSTWVVECSTMLSHSYDQNRMIEVTADPTGQSPRAGVVEMQTKKYTY